MTIIAALISRHDGAVASDGRLFGSAQLENGRPVQLAKIESDAFDKTFALGAGKVVGAFAGLMRFSGKTVGLHLTEVADESIGQGHNLLQLATHIRETIARRIEAIADSEVVFPERKLDLLLVGGQNLSSADMRIVSLRFFPRGDRIEAEENTVRAEATNRYYLHGSEQATAAAKKVFTTTAASSRSARSILNTAILAVKVGIKAAGTHKYGSDLDCGGQVFSRRYSP